LGAHANPLNHPLYLASRHKDAAGFSQMPLGLVEAGFVSINDASLSSMISDFEWEGFRFYDLIFPLFMFPQIFFVFLFHFKEYTIQFG